MVSIKDFMCECNAMRGQNINDSTSKTFFFSKGDEDEWKEESAKLFLFLYLELLPYNHSLIFP